MKYLLCYEIQTSVGLFAAHAYAELFELTERSLRAVGAKLRDNVRASLTQQTLRQGVVPQIGEVTWRGVARLDEPATIEVQT